MPRRLWLYFAILLALYGFLVVAMARNPARSQFAMSDFAIFYGSAQQYREGGSLYRRVDVERFIEWPAEWGPQPDFLTNLNPPFFTLLVLPFTLLGFAPAFLLWSALSLASGLAAMTLLERESRSGPASEVRRVGFLILLLAYFPVWATVQFGQVGLFLLLLAVLAWQAARRGGDARAGLLLGLALASKPFFGLFFLFFLVLRRLRLLIWMTVVLLFCTALGWIFFGTEAYLEYRSSLGGITWHSTSWNASFLGFFMRLLGGSENLSWLDRPMLARVLASALSVLAAVLLIWLADRVARRPSERRFDLGFCLTLVLMLLISPLGWLYYFPLLLPVFVLVWNHTEPAEGSWKGLGTHRWLLIGAFVLSCIPKNLIAASELNSPLDWFVWGGVYFYSLLILAGLLVTLSVTSDR